MSAWSEYMKQHGKEEYEASERALSVAMEAARSEERKACMDIVYKYVEDDVVVKIYEEMRARGKQ